MHTVFNMGKTLNEEVVIVSKGQSNKDTFEYPETIKYRHRIPLNMLLFLDTVHKKPHPYAVFFNQ